MLSKKLYIFLFPAHCFYVALYNLRKNARSEDQHVLLYIHSMLNDTYLL